TAFVGDGQPAARADGTEELFAVTLVHRLSARARAAMLPLAASRPFAEPWRPGLQPLAPAREVIRRLGRGLDSERCDRRGGLGGAGRGHQRPRAARPNRPAASTNPAPQTDWCELRK